MKTSENTESIAKAFAKAQGELETAPKSSTNPHFNSKFADLETCVNTAKKTLAKYGLGILQTVHTDIPARAVGVETRLIHETGQWYESGVTWCVPPKGLGPQDVGAATTYLRRYSFSSMIGLVTEEDDDGNKAQGLGKPPEGTKKTADDGKKTALPAGKQGQGQTSADKPKTPQQVAAVILKSFTDLAKTHGRILDRSTLEKLGGATLEKLDPEQVAMLRSLLADIKNGTVSFVEVFGEGKKISEDLNDQLST